MVKRNILILVVEYAIGLHCQPLEKMSEIANAKQPLCMWKKWHCSDFHKTHLSLKKSTMTHLNSCGKLKYNS